MKDLVPLDNPNPAVLFAQGGLNDLLARIEREARAIVPDISTTKGRKAIASAAANVARSKTYLDALGKDFVAHIKAQSATVDAERRAMRERLDVLKEEIRQPLTAWEHAEEERQARLSARLADLGQPMDPHASAEAIAARIAEIRSVPIDDTWGECITDAAQAKDAALFRLSEQLARAEEREEAHAKAEEERRAREAQERQAHEARIAREAAEQATRAAEARAAAEREAAERAAKAAEIQAEAERQAAERSRLAAVQAQQDAERRALEAEERRQREAVEAEARAQAAAEAAARAERERIAAEQQRAHAEAEARAANRQHKARINRDILAALVALEVAEDLGKRLIEEIARGRIPHVSITY